MGRAALERQPLPDLPADAAAPRGASVPLANIWSCFLDINMLLRGVDYLFCGVAVARVAWYFVPHMLLQVLAAELLAQPAPPGCAQPLLYCGSFGGSALPAGAAANMHVHWCSCVSLCTCGVGRV